MTGAATQGAIVQRIFNLQLVRYGLASIVALAVDTGMFLLLLSFVAASPVIASIGGYACGIVAHWLLSSRTVFAASVASDSRGRNRQKALFLASALLGLALTAVIVGTLDAFGFDVRLAKVVAIVASFAATWLMRERLVFR
ncbi:MAG: GtrA family protein [Novosphingobium sp.]|nr:GtrA family protein [Novosphingobium sp.]